jgi:type IV pilus assembly protein PilE
MDRALSVGFTLIELLIAVAIIAILSAVAIPSYTDHVRRGHAAAATAALATLRVSLEQYYQDHRRYGASEASGACGVTMPTAREFSYGCAAATDGQGFLVTATGDGTRGMGDFIYTIDHAGLRRTTGLPQGWGTVPSECWVKAKGGAC